MSAIFQTVQALHERVSRSAFRTPMLWGMLLVLFLLIYMPMLVRGGYHWDETLDFAGQGMETYVANGRWGLVLWRWVFGLGCAVWLNGLLAGGLLVAALVVQLRVLRVEHTGAQLLYGLLYLVQVQFAYQMDYFYQCDATAAGVLCVSLAALYLLRGGRGSLWGATLAVLFAVAVYQCLVLNFVVLLGLAVVQRMLAGEPAELWRTLWRGALVCVLAVLGWWGIKALVLQLAPVSDNVLVYCREYAERINYREQLFSAEWYVYLWRMFSTMVRDALIPLTYDGELFYAAAALAGVVLAVALCRRCAGAGAAVGRVLLLLRCGWRRSACTWWWAKRGPATPTPRWLSRSCSLLFGCWWCSMCRGAPSGVLWACAPCWCARRRLPPWYRVMRRTCRLASRSA